MMEGWFLSLSNCTAGSDIVLPNWLVSLPALAV